MKHSTMGNCCVGDTGRRCWGGNETAGYCTDWEEACSPWTDWRKEKADQLTRKHLGWGLKSHWKAVISKAYHPPPPPGPLGSVHFRDRNQASKANPSHAGWSQPALMEARLLRVNTPLRTYCDTFYVVIG